MHKIFLDIETQNTFQMVGSNNPVEIIIHLLIDKDIASLGHRKILLGKYTSAGVSIQPHAEYRFNTVLDFYY